MPAFQPVPAPAQTPIIGGLATAIGLGLIDFGPSDPQNRWQGGYGLYGPSCRGTYVSDPCQHLGPNKLDFPGWEQSVLGMPFIVGAGVACRQMITPSNIDEWHTKSDEMLNLCQWTEVAYELWTGEQAQASGWPNRYLASREATVLPAGPPGPVNVVEGIALLEDNAGLCKCGGPRLIHVPRKMIPYLSNAVLIHQEGQRWFTAAGSLIVTDDGYTGTGPDGAEPTGTTAWIYGTGPISYALQGDIFHPEPAMDQGAFNYPDNSISVRSERLAAASWLCCHYAVNVNYAETNG